MFHKHEKCLGILLFKWKHIYVELWICAPHYSVRKHFHKKQSNKIIFLFGSVMFHKKLQNDTWKYLTLNYKNIFKSFNINAEQIHYFMNMSRLPFIFINVAKFIDNYKPMSASEDIEFNL